jgi:hypothetical protein
MRMKSKIVQVPIFQAAVELVRPEKRKAVNLFKPHLGGYKPGGDYATSVKPLFERFFSEFTCRTALDVGCAEGLMVQAMLQIGYEAHGLEGLASVRRASPCPDRIKIHDLTCGPYLFDRRFDLVWCSEVVEHIKERYVGNVVLTLAGNCARYVAMTYGPRGSGGYHHVNCQPADYWIRWLESAGLSFDPDLTAAMKSHVATHCNGFRHFAKTGLVFRRPAQSR